MLGLQGGNATRRAKQSRFACEEPFRVYESPIETVLKAAQDRYWCAAAVALRSRKCGDDDKGCRGLSCRVSTRDSVNASPDLQMIEFGKCWRGRSKDYVQ